MLVAKDNNALACTFPQQLIHCLRIELIKRKNLVELKFFLFKEASIAEWLKLPCRRLSCFVDHEHQSFELDVENVELSISKDFFQLVDAVALQGVVQVVDVAAC